MRNPPECYLQTLREHVTHSPEWVSPSANTSLSRSASGGGITTYEGGKNTAFQRWFHFKEAFSPEFVTAAVASLGYRPDHVIDPFGGSGTSAITSQFLGLDATTIEVNPFLADVIKSKVAPLTAEALRAAAADFNANLQDQPGDLSKLSHWPPTFIQSQEKDRWIFPNDVALRLSQYLTCIDAIHDRNVQRFFRVVLGSVLVECSNIYVNGKGRRYRRNWRLNQPTSDMLDERFGHKFNISFEDVLRFETRPNSSISVINGDSRTALESVSEPADLIVFSPPYPNSFDYTDIYNVELWVLGYIGSSTDNRLLRNQTLRSHVQIKRKYDMPVSRSVTLDRTLEALMVRRDELWAADIPEMVGAYFRDLETVLEQSRRLLKSRGKVMIVVGDSRYASIRVEVGVILGEIAAALGFGQVSVRQVRQMRVSAQQGGTFQLAESIVELSL